MSSVTLVDSIDVTLAGGASIAIAHNIAENGVSKTPNFVMPDRASGLTVTSVTSTHVTFNNPTAGSLTATFYIERTHSEQMDPDNPVDVFWQGATSGGSTGTLQESYDAGSAGQQAIVLGASSKTGVAIRDAAVAIGSVLFEVTDNGDTVQYFGVDTTGPSTDVGMTFANSSVAVGGAGNSRLRASGGVLQVSNGGAAYAAVLKSGDVTLSVAYLAGVAGPQTTALDATRLGVVYSDAAAVGGNLLAVTDGTNPWFSVRSNEVWIGTDVVQFRQVPGAGPFSVSVQTPTAVNTAGFALTVGSGSGSASDNAGAGGAGATMTVSAGAGGAGGVAQVAGVGGSVAITAGSAGANAGGGGANGGNVTITPGAATGAGTFGSTFIAQADTATSTTSHLLTLNHTSSGTAAASYGTGILYRGQDSVATAGGDDMMSIEAIWSDPVSPSEDSALVVKLRAAGAALAEKFRVGSTGTVTTQGIAYVAVGVCQFGSGSGAVTLSSGSSAGSIIFNGSATIATWKGVNTSGSIPCYDFTPAAMTNQTASVSSPGFKYNTYTKQFATGTLADFAEFSIAGATYSFVGASTCNGFTLKVTPPLAGTNATLTAATSGALWLTGNVRFDVQAANATTACVFTAASGPAGANTAIQEWLPFINAAGVTRYIPCW